MKIRFFRTLTIVAIAGLLIACGGQDSTPTPATGAVVNIRQWAARPVVISLYYGPGYTLDEVAWSAMPSLVVYADGRVVVSTFDYVNKKYIQTVETGQIAPAEVCSLLNRIDGYGFFDYNAAEYTAPDVTDNGDTVIKVDAWRSMETRAYALGWALNPPNIPGLELPEMNVPSALSETHRLLADYRPANLAPYQPERIAVRVSDGWDEGEAAEWPLAAPSLKELAASPQDGDSQLVLEGQQAADVYALFGGDIARDYTDGEQRYTVAVRPLLPRETWARPEGWGWNSQFEQEPTVEMACAQ